MLTQLKTKLNQARREHASRDVAFLATIIGEAQAVGKNKGNREPTNEEVVQILKKFLVNNEETRKLLKGKEVPDLDAERVILLELLPAQLSAGELETIIAGRLALGCDNLSEVMQHLKANYPGRYDGKLAQGLAKTLLVG